MNNMLDIVGAVLIGGMVMLMIMNLNTASSMHKFASDSELKLQQNTKTLAEIINSDMRKIGYNKSTGKIISAQIKFLSFYADIDSNGTPEIVSYKLGDTSDARGTENPFDRPLIRVVNNDTSKGPSLGLSDLKFTYNNKLGIPTTYPDSIKFIKVEMWIQSTDKIDNQYTSTYWEMTINPRNL